MNKGYSRATRVADLLKEEISQMLLKEVKDPHVGFVTITGVEVSKDLQVAKAFYTILGDEAQIKELILKIKKEHQYNPQSEYVQEIIIFGNKATPLLIEEWKKIYSFKIYI